MELYSFAFDQEESYDGLISSNAFVEMIQSSFPEVVIIDGRLKSRKNMSKVFSDQQYSDILDALYENYQLKKKYFDKNFGEDFFMNKIFVVIWLVLSVQQHSSSIFCFSDPSIRH